MVGRIVGAGIVFLVLGLIVGAEIECVVVGSDVRAGEKANVSIDVVFCVDSELGQYVDMLVYLRL